MTTHYATLVELLLWITNIPTPLLIVGRRITRWGNLTNALHDFNRAIELNGRNTFAFLHRGKLYLEMKQYDNALPDLNRAIELDDQDANAFVTRGRAYHEIRNNMAMHSSTFIELLNWMIMILVPSQAVGQCTQR